MEFCVIESEFSTAGMRKKLKREGFRVLRVNTSVSEFKTVP